MGFQRLVLVCVVCVREGWWESVPAYILLLVLWHNHDQYAKVRARCKTTGGEAIERRKQDC